MTETTPSTATAAATEQWTATLADAKIGDRVRVHSLDGIVVRNGDSTTEVVVIAKDNRFDNATIRLGWKETGSCDLRHQPPANALDYYYATVHPDVSSFTKTQAANTCQPCQILPSEPKQTIATLAEARLGQRVKVFVDENGYIGYSAEVDAHGFPSKGTKQVEATVIGRWKGGSSLLLGWLDGEAKDVNGSPRAYNPSEIEYVGNQHLYTKVYSAGSKTRCILLEDNNEASSKPFSIPAVVKTTVGDMKKGTRVLIFLNEHNLISSTPTPKTIEATVGGTYPARLSGESEAIKLEWNLGQNSPFKEQRCLRVAPHIICIPLPEEEPAPEPAKPEPPKQAKQTTTFADVKAGDRVRCYRSLDGRELANNPNGLSIDATVLGTDHIEDLPYVRIGWKEGELHIGKQDALVVKGLYRNLHPSLDEFCTSYCAAIDYHCEILSHASDTSKEQSETAPPVKTSFDRLGDANIGDRVQVFLATDNSISSHPTAHSIEATVIGKGNGSFVRLGWKDNEASANVGIASPHDLSRVYKEVHPKLKDFPKSQWGCTDYPCVILPPKQEKTETVPTQETEKPGKVKETEHISFPTYTTEKPKLGDKVKVFLEKEGELYYLSNKPTDKWIPATIVAVDVDDPKYLVGWKPGEEKLETAISRKQWAGHYAAYLPNRDEYLGASFCMYSHYACEIIERVGFAPPSKVEPLGKEEPQSAASQSSNQEEEANQPKEGTAIGTIAMMGAVLASAVIDAVAKASKKPEPGSIEARVLPPTEQADDQQISDINEQEMTQ